MRFNILSELGMLLNVLFVRLELLMSSRSRRGDTFAEWKKWNSCRMEDIIVVCTSVCARLFVS